MPNETTTQILKFRNKWLQIGDTVRFNYLEPVSGLTDAEDPSPPKCKQIRREMFIQWDGRVRLCAGYQKEYIGSVRESSIAELWRHPRLDYLRKCNDHRDFALARRCMRCCNCR